MAFDQKEYMKGYNKKYYIGHKDKIIENNKKWKKNNPGYMKKYGKQWQKNNPGYKRRYCENNQERIKELQKKWMESKRKTDLKYNLNRKIGKRINYSLKNNGSSKIWGILGYTKNDLIIRLKNTIPKDCTWQDYIDKKLEIDHIIPILAFNFTNPEHIDFKKCWSLSNLRLLPTKENLIKRAKLEKPFQPALKIIYREADINEIKMV